MISPVQLETKRPLLEENLGLAYSAALEFVQPRKVAVEDTEEYADALEGLWKACETWDESLGNRFSTYAHHCMRNAILDGRRNRGRRSVETITLEKDRVADAHADWLEGQDMAKLIASLFEETPDETDKQKREKYCLFKHYIENASWEELGQQFGVSRNRAFQYGQQAILFLRKKANGNGDIRQKQNTRRKTTSNRNDSTKVPV